MFVLCVCVSVSVSYGRYRLLTSTIAVPGQAGKRLMSALVGGAHSRDRTTSHPTPQPPQCNAKEREREREGVGGGRSYRSPSEETHSLRSGPTGWARAHAALFHRSASLSDSSSGGGSGHNGGRCTKPPPPPLPSRALGCEMLQRWDQGEGEGEGRDPRMAFQADLLVALQHLYGLHLYFFPLLRIKVLS